MTAITLWQPHATLVAIGAKRIETRRRNTAYRGELAIHAAKRWEADQYALCLTEPFFTVLKNAGYIRASAEYGWRSPVIRLPLGAIIATTTLRDTRRTEHLVPSDEMLINPVLTDISIRTLGLSTPWPLLPLTDQERAFGNYSPRRFGLLLDGTRQLSTPVQYRGLQAVPFTIRDDAVVALVRKLAA